MFLILSPLRFMVSMLLSMKIVQFLVALPKKVQAFIVGVVAFCFAPMVMAVSTIADLANAVSFTDVVAAIFTVAGVVIAVLITIRGVRWIFAIVRR